MNKEKIMIIDDEKEINELIQSYLKKEGYDIYSAYDGRTALKMVSEVNPDLIILDVMLPDIDGKDLCFEIRKRTNCSILFLSCKSEELDKIIALSVGGDDYITKPFLPGELMARINAHLRRSRMANFNMPQNEVYHFPGLTVNIDNHEVFVDHQ
ncbi:MAG: response regulator transcription factor, partial [Clostridia bacterium]|nr:response regulator transcription factor [Clostridia bacterium]